MRKSVAIDGAWFKQQFELAGLSLREVARRLPAKNAGKSLDPSALSRALNGNRKMSLGEVRLIARILNVNEEFVMQKALGPKMETAPASETQGFSERDQTKLTQQADQGSLSNDPSKPRRHPAWGALKGTTIIMSGVDLTAPTAPEWGQLDEK